MMTAGFLHMTPIQGIITHMSNRFKYCLNYNHCDVGIFFADYLCMSHKPTVNTPIWVMHYSSVTSDMSDC